MKANRRNWEFLFLGMSLMILIAGLISGCSQRRSITGADTGESSGSGSAEEFPMQVQMAGHEPGEDPGIPSEQDPPLMKSTDGDAVVDWTDSALVVQWTKRLPFPKDAQAPEVFFVFPENALGSHIQNAFYRHSVLNSENGLKTADSQESATYIARDRSWSIPVFRTFSSGLGALDTGVIALQLQLSDGTNREVEVRFNIQSDLPESRQVMTSTTETSMEMALEASSVDNSSLMKQLQKDNSGGRLVGTEIYKNPTQRPLVLWFHYISSSLTLSQKVAKHLSAPVIHGESELLYEAGSDFYSLASLDRLELDLAPSPGASGSSEDQFLAPSEWKSHVLLPGQVLNASWTVYPDASTQHCTDGILSIKTQRVCQSTSDRNVDDEVVVRYDQDLGKCDPGTLRQKDFQVQDRLLGFSIVGALRREVMIAEVGDNLSQRPAAELAKQGGHLLLASPDVEVARSQLYSCQGIF